MSKKLWLGFIVVFIAMAITSFIVHGVILSSCYKSDEMANIWRTDMNQKMWIYYLVYIFISFFFVLIYSKWYKGKGIIEGIQYGVYTGFMMSVPYAYSTYAMIAMPYSIAFQWFIYGMIQYIIYGILVSLIYGKKSQESTTP
jgi:hypothetical protein